jgi:PKD repeat protein
LSERSKKDLGLEVNSRFETIISIKFEIVYFMKVRLFSVQLAWVATLIGSLGPVSSIAQEVNPAGKAFPVVNLPRAVPAAMLERQLGPEIAEMAKWYGYGEAEFRKMLSEERSMRADRQGYLHYVCAGLVAPAGGATGAAATVTQPTYALTDTFRLHSRPGASKVIYLDFDGHVTSGTSWNSSYNGGTSFTTPAYDIGDGSGVATMSNAELTRIQGIWKRVAEDFMIYDVDVTTEDPGVEALRKSTTSDALYGVRVCIGGSSYDWFKQGAGGVAYLGSYDWNTDTPCYVFTAQLGTGNEKFTAEAASHEVGHTLRLKHDGQTNITEYYEGHSNWAPIMGVSYYKDVTQWSKGEYPSANNLEDDTAVMLGEGISRRADEHGDSIANATVLSGTSVVANGIISTVADADLFRFTTGAGAVSFTATPAVPSPNLDVQLAVYDGSGTLVTFSNPAGMAGSLSANLAAGTYYLALDGVGTGSPLTAYNDYGSLGEYSLAGNLVPTGNQPPIVVASATPTTGTAPLAVGFSSGGTFDADGSITAYDWQFGDGASSTLANPSHSYSQPGTYQATLVAWDNGGLSGSASVTITVLAPVVTRKIYVSNIQLVNTSKRANRSASASVTVRDSNGAVVPGAVVSGSWSGLVSGNATVTTGTNGVATFRSPVAKRGGTIFFTVNGITASGSSYDATLNAETTDSIAVQ